MWKGADMQEAFEKIIEKLEERTSFLSDCTKYGNKDAEQQRKSCSTMMMYEVADLVDDLIEIVKQEAEQYNNGWIPCSERLPEVPEGTEDDDCPEFNVTIKGASRAAILRCSSDGTWFDEFGHIYPVIAWQPLPAPYQPKGE